MLKNKKTVSAGYGSIFDPATIIDLKWGKNKPKILKQENLTLQITDELYSQLDEKFWIQTMAWLKDFSESFPSEKSKNIKIIRPYSKLLNKYLNLGEALKVSAFYTLVSTLPVSYWVIRGAELYNSKGLPEINNPDIIYATGLICGVYCVSKAVFDFKLEYDWKKNMWVGATTYQNKLSNPIIKILEMGNSTVIHELTHAMSNKYANSINSYLPNACACFFDLYYFEGDDTIAEIGSSATKNTGSKIFSRDDWRWSELAFIPDPKEPYAQAFDPTVRNIKYENYGIQNLISGSIIEMHRQGYPKEIVWEYLKDIEEQGIENTETNENLLAKHQKRAKEKFLKLPN